MCGTMDIVLACFDKKTQVIGAIKVNSKRRFINVSYTMSYEEHAEGFIMPEFHFHNDYEIYILEKGMRTVSTKDMEFATKAGDAVLFKSGMPHKSRGTGGFSGICIHFSEIYLKRYFATAAIDGINTIFEAGCIHIGALKLADIKKMTDEFWPDDEYNFLKLAKVFGMLAQELEAETPEETVFLGDDKKVNNKTAAILDYVDENYAYIKNVAELSEYFGVSESYLFRIFKNRYDMTVKTYINKLRIKNICNRLKYSKRPAKALAAEYGFESYEHFCRVFKKEMGCTPTEFRNRSEK